MKAGPTAKESDDPEEGHGAGRAEWERQEGHRSTGGPPKPCAAAEGGSGAWWDSVSAAQRVDGMGSWDKLEEWLVACAGTAGWEWKEVAFAACCSLWRLERWSTVLLSWRDEALSQSLERRADGMGRG